MNRLTLPLALSVLFGASTPEALAPQTPSVSEELAEVRRVLQTPRVERAMAYVLASRDETLTEWMSICNADGASGREGNRSRLLYKLFRIYGLDDVRIDDSGTVVGIRRGVGGGPTVVLNAHHDNVALSPEGQSVEAFIADGRMWCPAAFDDLAGVAQLLGVLRAMNAAGIETRGDVWFVGLTGEEAPHGPDHPDASPGVERLVRAHVPRDLDWRKGDIMMQFHGRGGSGVTTGSTPIRNRSQLRVFAPFEGDRWAPHAVDALGRIVVRLSDEVRDPRASGEPFPVKVQPDPNSTVLYLNMAMIHASDIIARPASEAWVRFDLRADTDARLQQAHDDIRRIAAEETARMGEQFSFSYEINSVNGTEAGVPGWNPADNRPARVAAAAGVALYGGPPMIDPSTGCGDCVRAFTAGMPAMSFRGSVREELGDPLPSVEGFEPVRRKSTSHDVTESAEIAQLWPGLKQGLLFTITYAGLAN